MAVFLAACDETGQHDGRGLFFTGGYMAPVTDWVDYFAPAWEERVLNGPPPIPFLHMVDIRGKEWREKYGLTGLAAEARVDEACRVIDSMGSLHLLTFSIHEGHFKDQFEGFRLLRPNTSQIAFDPMVPDIHTFLGFLIAALKLARHLDAEKVDFLVEKKQTVTPILQIMFDRAPEMLRQNGDGDLVKYLGEFIPGCKERVPLQAADVVCWHIQRAAQGQLDRQDLKRIRKLTSKPGYMVPWEDQWTTDQATRARDVAIQPPAKKRKTTLNY